MGKKILFVAPAYFGIQERIRKKLIERGNEVFYVNDSESSFFSAFTRHFTPLRRICQQRRRRKLEQVVRREAIDILFVIRGMSLSDEDWKIFFANTDIPLRIMYQWDSMHNCHYAAQIGFYDKVITFDRQDSLTYGLSYHPLFWTRPEKNKTQSVREDIDLLFVGIWHSDRIKLLKKIVDEAETKGLSYFVKVYYPFFSYLWLRYVKKLPIESSFWTFRRISSKQMKNLYERARCIIDINHPMQSGLTMRTMECIGYGKKLLTTNPYICQEPFYNKDNILVIDREARNLDFSFLSVRRTYEHVDDYELGNWLNDILGNEF